MVTYIRAGFALALLSVVFSACSHENLEVPDNQKTFRMAGDFIRNNYDLMLFAAAVERAGLREELNGEGPFTLLAPSNSAFNELGITRASDFNRLNADSLRNMLHYHMLGRRLTVNEVPANSLDARYASLYEGREPFFTYVAYGPSGPAWPFNDLYINGAFAMKNDVALENGTLHVIDKVMKYTPGTVQDWLAARPEYSVFVAGLKQFGLWDQLAGKGPFTVFAPDNAALEAGGITLDRLPDLRAERYSGARLFGIYIMPGRRFFVTDFQAATDLYNEGGFKGTIQGDSYIFSVSGRKNNYNLSPASYTLNFVDPPRPERQWELTIRSIEGNISGRNDNLTDNGIVHFLPGALVLPEEARNN